MPTVLSCVAIGALWVVGVPRAVAQTSDEQFLDGLRQRQLFALAEKFCRDRLGRPELPDAARGDLTIELARCLTEEALQSSPEKRAALWREALATVDEFAQENPQHPRLVQIRIQRGLVELAWGELLAQEIEGGSNRARRIDEARDHLRQAIDELRGGAEKAAELQRRQQGARKGGSAELSAAQLRSLERNAQYQLARALRNQGETYPVDSPDRTNSLTQAVELLRTLAQADAEDTLAWPSRLDAATCYRLLGHHEAAARRLEQIDDDTPPARVALRSRAERIRLALAERQIEVALALIGKGRMIDGVTSADLEYATLEAYLAAWRADADAGRQAEADAWQTKAAAVVRDIERAHGPYWRRRAESLFAEQIAASPTTTNIEVLAQAAEGFYRAGQPQEALAAFDRAVQAARSAGQDAQAFALGYSAAAIEQERKNYADAAERFRQVAMASPKLPKAADAHLLAIFDLGQVARAGNDDALSRYVKLLDEHLATWPQLATASRAHLWRARVYEQDREWKAANEHFAAVAANSPEAGEAVAGLARTYQELLTAQRAAGQATSAPALNAVTTLEATSGIKDVPAEKWTAAQRATVLAMATILLEFTNDGYAKAERLLSTSLHNSPQADEAWRASAHALLAYAIAAQGRVDDAQQQIENIAGAGTAALETLIPGLDRLCQTAQPQLRRNLAALELHAIELLRDQSATATADQRRALALAHARALFTAERPAEALAELRQLAADNPRDGNVQEALALGLWEAKDEGALRAWQNIESKSRSGSDRWLRAKLYEARIYARTGEQARARQTVNVVKTLYPEMGGPGLQRQFLEILKGTD